MEATKDAFSFIYIEYCCDEETKKDLIEECKKNDFKVQEQYKYENLFKDKKMKNEKLSIVVYEKNSLFKKILDKIKNFF